MNVIWTDYEMSVLRDTELTAKDVHERLNRKYTVYAIQKKRGRLGINAKRGAPKRRKSDFNVKMPEGPFEHIQITHGEDE